MSIAFDALEYARELENAGFTREQAEVQARAIRRQAEAQAAAFKEFASIQDEKSRKELATRGDISSLKNDISEVKSELRETELRLQKEIKETELRFLKWQWGIAFALAAIMAKGFGWLGF